MEKGDLLSGKNALNSRDRQVLTDKASRPARTALILYGSETGNAQDVAEEVGRMAERLRFDTTVLDMDSIQLRDLLKPTVVIFAVSTTGQGEMPQNARRLWKTLLSGALKPGILRKMRFSSFGLGDSSYARFNVAHRMLCNRLSQLGAQAFCERGEGNEQHPEGHSAGLREWIVALKQKLLNDFPLPLGTEPSADDEFLEPKWKLGIQAQPDYAFGTRLLKIAALNGIAEKQLEQDDSNDLSSGSDDPSYALLPMNQTHLAYIAANERVTASDHFQDVRLLDLHLEDRVEYGPGAVAIVHPKNFPSNVDEFINLMGWEHIVNAPLDLVSNTNATDGMGYNPSPLRHLNLSQINLTLRWLLENVLDIMSIPRRSFFASLLHFVGDDTEDEAYQKERLLELANPELIDELWDYTTRPKRTIVEVMMDFTTVKIPWQYALSVLPIMKGRQFSIASGGHLRQTNEGKTRVQLLVAIVDPPSPIIKWRRRYGVCTRYIASLQPGREINIGMQPGYLDVQQSELEEPVVMIGPGTGLAPMRSMTWQRHMWASERSERRTGRRLDRDILIFGCRSEHADYFFRQEWDQFQRTDGLTVLTAFSRDREKRKQYVQDRIREDGSLIRNAILECNGKIYLSGSSGNMPKGVREALLDVFAEHAILKTRENAEGYLDQMEKSGRYKQETW